VLPTRSLTLFYSAKWICDQSTRSNRDIHLRWRGECQKLRGWAGTQYVPHAFLRWMSVTSRAGTFSHGDEYTGQWKNGDIQDSDDAVGVDDDVHANSFQAAALAVTLASQFLLQASRMVRARSSTRMEPCTQASTEMALAMALVRSGLRTARSTRGNTATIACTIIAVVVCSSSAPTRPHNFRSGMAGARSNSATAMCTRASS